MPTPYLKFTGPTAEGTARAVADALEAARAEVGVPDAFPAEVEEAAARSAADLDELLADGSRADLRDVVFCTIDPPGSMDLDQALSIERAVVGPGASAMGELGGPGRTGGYVVHYAIADVAAFVPAGGPVDTEAHARGTTVYGPDSRTPLHPTSLSEGAASLLPGVDRPAVVWHVHLDGTGEIVDVHVERAVVRSRQRLSYDEAQRILDTGVPTGPADNTLAGTWSTVDGILDLLREVGRLRQEREVARGGVSLDVPEQEVTTETDGTVGLHYRSTLPVEEWNAQVSLLTGIAAARLMRAGGVGIFRTLPPADERDVARLRRTAKALGIRWRDNQGYGDLLRSLDSSKPAHAAFLTEATSLFRGASYAPFGGTGTPAEPPEHAEHAAIAAEYAHVTAPLRRLVDRYGTEACLAHAARTTVPAWVLDGLAALPRTMATTGQRAGSYERASLDILEAALLTDRVGQTFDGVVVDVDEARDTARDAARDTARDPARDPAGGDARGDASAQPDESARPQQGQLMLHDPAVRAPVTGDSLPLGETVRAVLTEASVPQRRVRFALADRGR